MAEILEFKEALSRGWVTPWAPDTRFHGGALELKVEDVDDKGIIKGHPSIFDNVDSYGDVVHKGAFEKTLKRRGLKGVKILYQHSTWDPIGLPMAMHEDQKGLYSEGQLVLDDPQGRRAHTLIKHGVIDALSIGFYADPKLQRYEEVPKQNRVLRHLLEIDLWEWSPVTFGANTRAKITSVKQARNPRELEAILRQVPGLSISAAKYIAANFKFPEPPCEAGALAEREARLLYEMAEELRNVRATLN